MFKAILQFLFHGVSGQFNNLHAVAQCRLNGVQRIRGSDKKNFR